MTRPKYLHTVYLFRGSEKRTLARFETWDAASDFFYAQPDRSSLYMGTVKV